MKQIKYRLKGEKVSQTQHFSNLATFPAYLVTLDADSMSVGMAGPA
jgi:hypothetical protein